MFQHLLDFFCTVNIEKQAKFIIAELVLFYLGGLVITMCAFLHSDINLGISYAKSENKPSLLLKFIRCLLYLVYILYIVGFFGVYYVIH
ncbi:hypothetical protein RaK2_00501 [Klebsiella phage vB_KleM_RaK2]|uniref:Uncharacterized protein n=1 Tax=Klebsiella phage vB_KleM_RaK2 TaxID=1147094 RepID=H6X4V8_9CAUD|nr:hypothetical protein F403_gp034 [Klebsiella phage vB_KleM_RaK2]AFA44774.1 hypothetical protein RaK2_00501 [Klebsiella phage vB_KleM_RaK2]